MKLDDRFWKKVNKFGPIPTNRPELGNCWIWLSGSRDGYGMFHIRHNGGFKRGNAHRFSYEEVFGPIESGLELDHLCRTRPCVRPSHLEAVTKRENILRGVGRGAINARKNLCANGHSYVAGNIYYEGRWRRCRTCARASYKVRYDKKLLSIGIKTAVPNSEKTRCKRGHEFSKENTIHTKRGSRTCRTCQYSSQRAWYRRVKKGH
jgi:hypothetical protein